jgi:hypothetical protein
VENTLVARPRVATSPSWGRIGLVYGGASLVVAALFVAARALAPLAGPLPVLASVVAGTLAILLVGSLAEWVVHGKLMHWRTKLQPFRLAYELHHRAHHWLHYRPDGYLKDEVTWVSMWPPRPERCSRERSAKVSAILGQGLFYAVFAIAPIALAWWVTANVAFTGALFLGSAAIVYLAVHLHDAVHCPGHTRLERFSWFWWLDRHHYLHHVDTRANVNFLLPLGDLLLGTLRLELTPDERERWPSYEEARAVVHAAG